MLAIGVVTLIAGIAMTATDNGVVVVTIGLVALGIGGVLLSRLRSCWWARARTDIASVIPGGDG